MDLLGLMDYEGLLSGSASTSLIEKLYGCGFRGYSTTSLQPIARAEFIKLEKNWFQNSWSTAPNVAPLAPSSFAVLVRSIPQPVSGSGLTGRLTSVAQFRKLDFLVAQKDEGLCLCCLQPSPIAATIAGSLSSHSQAYTRGAVWPASY
jgi:hypothetical protein